MDLDELQRHWDTFGRQDPYWAILTDPARRGNRWPIEAFFETGRREVDGLMRDAERLGVPGARRRALDFGCGAGRLTQAIAGHFESVLGIDVAPSMIALAKMHNRHGERCSYEVNDRADLSRWPTGSFDLIYTSRVLQHINPQYSMAYIREFARLLAPGGYLSFDLPSGSGDAAARVEGTVPPSAMRGRVRLLGPSVATGEVPAGASLPARVAVTNVSDATGQATPAHPINVGNHWLSEAGLIITNDDARAALPSSLPPGATAEVDLVISTPATPGVYRLQVDVVQEGVAWFASCGSEPADVPLRVGVPAAPPASATPEEEVPDSDETLRPVMEMHAVPRAEVETLLAAAGVRVLDVRRVHHCGPQWLAYRYDVTAPGDADRIHPAR